MGKQREAKEVDNEGKINRGIKKGGGGERVEGIGRSE